MPDSRGGAAFENEKSGTGKYCARPRRAAFKVALVLIAITLLVALLSLLVRTQDMTELKESLSLGTIIALVLIINLLSFGCFVVMVAAWQWVRRDLKPPRMDDAFKD